MREDRSSAVGVVGCGSRLPTVDRRPTTFRIEPRPEQLHRQPREPRIADERAGDAGAGGDGADLEGVVGVGAEHVYLAPAQPGGENERVERIARRVALADGEERLGEEVRALGGDRAAFGVLHREGVDHHLGELRPGDGEGGHLHHPQPGVVEHRHEVGEDEPLAGEVELQLHRALDRLLAAARLE
jgi:hypothetical protein